MDYEKFRKTLEEIQEILRQMDRLAQQYNEGKIEVEKEVMVYSVDFKTKLINKYIVLKTTLANKIKELP